MAFRWSPGDPVARGFVHPANVIPGARDGVVLRIELRLESDGRVTVASLRAAPFWTINTVVASREAGAPPEIRVVPMSEAPALARQERLGEIIAALGDEVTFEDAPPPPREGGR